MQTYTWCHRETGNPWPCLPKRGFQQISDCQVKKKERQHGRICWPFPSHAKYTLPYMAIFRFCTKKKRSIMFNWSRNCGFTYTPVPILRGEHMVYSCVYFIYANGLKQPRTSVARLTEWYWWFFAPRVDIKWVHAPLFFLLFFLFCLLFFVF